MLYRAAVEDVPVREYTLPLGKADILVTGKERVVTVWCDTWSYSEGKDELRVLSKLQDNLHSRNINKRFYCKKYLIRPYYVSSKL